MRPLFLTALCTLAGCASSGSLPPGAAPTRILETAGGYDIHLASEAPGATYTVDVPPERAISVLAAVYQEMEIPVTLRDPATRSLGNPELAGRRRLAGRPLSAYLDCGHTLTGPVADNYRVQLSVITSLQPAEGGKTRVVTRVGGQARSNEGASGHPVTCTSRGRLEEQIASGLRAKLTP